MIGDTARPIGRSEISSPDLAGGGGDFQADEASADDDDALARSEFLANRLRVQDRAQADHIDEIRARNVQLPRARAGRQDQPVPGQGGAAGEFELSPLAVDPRRFVAERQRDAMLMKERFRAQRQSVEIDFALQKRLGERRALIGEMRLVAD